MMGQTPRRMGIALLIKGPVLRIVLSSLLVLYFKCRLPLLLGDLVDVDRAVWRLV